MTIRYDAMLVREYESQGQARSQWTRIGTAFVNKDGSIGLALDAIPTDWTKSKIILQVPKTKEEIEALRAEKLQSGGGQQQRAPRRNGPPQQGVQPNLPRNRAPRQAPAPTPDYPQQWDDEAQAGEPAGFADEDVPE